MYYIYVLAEKNFIEEINKNIKNKELIISTTSDVELFKKQIESIKEYENSLVIIDENKIAKKEKIFFFFGKKRITYNYFDNMLKKINMLSFEIKSFKELEPKIMNYFEKEKIISKEYKELKEENLKQNNNLIVDYQENIEEEYKIQDEVISEFNVEELIAEANENVENDFNEETIENIINETIEETTTNINNKNQAIDKDINKEELIKNKIKSDTEQKENKNEIIEEDIEEQITEDEINALFSKKKKKKIAKKINGQTVGQNLLNHLTDDEVYDLVQKGAL